MGVWPWKETKGLSGTTLYGGMRLVGQVTALIVLSTFAFDIIHFLLHRWAFSSLRPLRFAAALHGVHHRFLDDRLAFDDSLIAKNILHHQIPEYATQLMVTALALFVFPPAPVIVACVIHSVVFSVVVWQRGKDKNHRSLNPVPVPPLFPVVGPAYHSLHHLFPDRFFGSCTPLFDWLFGTGCHIRGRRVAMTGASGALGAPLKLLLEREGAIVEPLKFNQDYVYENYSGADAVLKRCDVLVLCHGSKKQFAMQANCDSFVALIERFRQITPVRQAPPEVWAVGSEIEAHPAFGNEDLKIYLDSKRAFARHAWRYYRSRDFIYRHIVPSAFTSAMGPGLISGERAAKIAWFFIRRGFRYVPVTYTGIALVNYLKFLFFTAPAPEGQKRLA